MARPKQLSSYAGKKVVIALAVLVAFIFAPGISGQQFTYQILRTGNYRFGEATIPYQLIKMTSRNGGYAYAQWFPPAGSGRKTAVLYTFPYVGIDWSPEIVDSRWASRPSATEGYAWPDNEEPSYGTSTAEIRYQLLAPTSNQVIGNAIGFLLNGTGVLFVYDRFYAGGHLNNDIDDVAAGLDFLVTQTSVDRSRVGVYGASWGGMEALYATAYSPSTLKPAATVALYPPLDIEKFVDHVNVVLPSLVQDPSAESFYASLFDPYLRRIQAAVGTDYSTVNSTALRTRLTKPTLIMHDDWDTVVPSTMSREFVAQSASHIEGLWFPHTTPANFEAMPPNHVFPQEGLTQTAANMFAHAFILTRIFGASDPVRVLYHSGDMTSYFVYLRRQQLDGQDVRTVVPRLIELCDPRVWVTDYGSENSPTAPGAYYISLVLNVLWGTELDMYTVRDYLVNEGLPD